MRKRMFAALLALGLLVLSGCEKPPERVEFTSFAMDTVMSFTLYGDREKCSIARSIIGMILSDYEAVLSATREGSDVDRVNKANGQPVELEGSSKLLERALELCQVTSGALDITAYPAVKAWGFSGEEHRVPSPAELEELAGKIDYTAITLEGDTVTLPAGMEIDLGAVAKGYVGNVLADRKSVV